MPNDDGALRIGTEVDISALREAQAAVNAATRNMAEAQQQFGRAAEQGSEQAAAALKLYQTEVESANAALAELAGVEEAETAVLKSNISARMAASAELRVLEGNLMGSTRAAGAFLTTLPGIGAAMQVAFPIFGAVALAEILVRIGTEADKLIEDAASFREQWENAFKVVAQQGEEQVRIWEQTTRLMHEAGMRSNPLGTLKVDAIDAQNAINGIDSAIKKIQDRIDTLRSNQAKAASEDWALPVEQRSGSYGPEILAAQERLNTLTAQRKELVEQLAKATADLGAKQTEVDKKNEASAREAYAQRLAFEKETGTLIDSEARKELEAYTKLAELKSRGGAGAGRLEVDPQDAKTLDDYVEKQSGLWKAQNDAYDIQEKINVQMHEAQIRYQEAVGAITPLEASYAMAAEHARQYSEQLADLNALLAEQKKSGNDVGAAQTQNQIAGLGGQRQVQAIQDQTQAAQLAAQPWVSAANEISNAWFGAFNRMVVGGRDAWHNMQKAEEQLVMSGIQHAEQWVAKWLEAETRQLVAHLVTNEGRVASDASAAAQSATISATESLKEATHAAGVAAANTWAAVSSIPIIGPELAPPAAAAAYSGVLALAAFDQGTSFVPRDGIAMIHQGETILPPPEAEVLRDALSGGRGSQSGQPGGLQLHYSPTFTSHGTPSDARKTVKDLGRMLRNMNLTT